MLRMSAAEWIRDAEKHIAAGVKAVELVTLFDVLFVEFPFGSELYELDGINVGVLVSGWGWDAGSKRWVKHGFKLRLPRLMWPDEQACRQLAAEFWPGVRVVVVPDPEPRRFVDMPPEDPACVLPPGTPPPILPGEPYPSW